MEFSVPPAPPFCGQRLLSHLVDERAHANHTRPFASIPRATRAADGYTNVSYRDFANAIDRLALWITDNIGHPERECETVVYLAPGDLRYQIVALAAVKAGFMMFFVSPRNSLEAFRSLLDQSRATKLLTDQNGSPGVSAMLKCQQMSTYTIHLSARCSIVQKFRMSH